MTKELVLGAWLLVALFLSGCGERSVSSASGTFPDQKLKGPNRFNKGVVLAWRKGLLPVDGQPNRISVGQTLMVRLRNLDGWLISKLTDNRISGEPDMTPEQRKNYILLNSLLKGDEGAKAFLKRYESAGLPTVGGSPAAVPSPLPLETLPPGLTLKQLRDAENSYEALFNTLKRQLFLVINNSQFRQLKAENPDAGSVDFEVKAKPEDTVHELEFRLRRRPGDEDAWSNLYDGTKAVHDVRVSVGVELDGSVFVLDTAVFPQADAKVQHLMFELFRESWLWSTLFGLALLLVGSIALGAKTPLLRDTDLPMRADGWPQFSLSRLQLAFWTYVVVGAFLIIWLVTDRLDTLNVTVLALLGISSGTTFASKLANMVTLDEGGASRLEPRRAARRLEAIPELRSRLSGEIYELQARAEELAKQAKPAPAEQQDPEAVVVAIRMERLQDDIDYLKHNRVTRFFIDLLSENGRVTLHRMQIVVWTAVLGVVFITRVWRELSMPVFSDTLLGLMGLSALTYVALKVPELKKVQADVKASAKA